jgi:hypothetical protein
MSKWLLDWRLKMKLNDKDKVYVCHSNRPNREATIISEGIYDLTGEEVWWVKMEDHFPIAFLKLPENGKFYNVGNRTYWIKPLVCI